MNENPDQHDEEEQAQSNSTPYTNNDPVQDQDQQIAVYQGKEQEELGDEEPLSD